MSLISALMASIFLFAGVCCLTLSSVAVYDAAGGRADRPPARGRSSGRHSTADQYGYVPLERHLVICSIAIAYNMRQIIKSFCVCACVCPSVDTLTVAFFRPFSPNWTQRCKPTKVRTSSLGSISPHPFPYFPPKNNFGA